MSMAWEELVSKVDENTSLDWSAAIRRRVILKFWDLEFPCRIVRGLPEYRLHARA